MLQNNKIINNCIIEKEKILNYSNNKFILYGFFIYLFLSIIYSWGLGLNYKEPVPESNPSVIFY